MLSLSIWTISKPSLTIADSVSRFRWQFPIKVFHNGFIIFCQRLVDVPDGAATCSRKTKLPPGLKTRLISLKQAFKFVTEQQTSDDTT